VNKKLEKEIRVLFGEHLKKLRLLKGFSMRGFANEADIDYSQVVRIENGIISPTLSTCYKIAETLDIPLKELFDFKYPSQIKSK
jgi:transcriptional regulator with XRE-family HTH domain